MSETKTQHTPGPWDVFHAGPDGRLWITTKGHALGLAMVTGAPGEEANARLIAAAPDLFEALAEFVEMQDEVDKYPTSDGHPVFKARRALRKARGEPEPTEDDE